MLMDFIATLAAGGVAAMVVFIINHQWRGLLPRWSMPAAMGLAMLGFSIWNEYSWYPRVVAQLPDTVEVALAPSDAILYRPWTYLFPMVHRFVAVDRASAVRPADDPALMVASAMVIQRWVPTKRVPIAFDCAKGARADLVEGAELAADGILKGAEWREVGMADALVMAACKEG